MFKTNISILLLILMLLSGVVYPLRAHALIGIVDLDIDLSGIATWIVDIVVDTVVETLKQRLLRTVTNKIITYIQGEGDPKFLKNFDGVLEDSFQAAIGDTVIELGGADLCDNEMRFEIEAQLKRQRKFENSVSCTLDDVVGNITAFKDNFEDGGWIGYRESLKLQNNPAGLMFLTKQNIINKKTEEENKTTSERAASDGFYSTKQCTEWIVLEKRAWASIDLDRNYDPNSRHYFDQGETLNNANFYKKTPENKSWDGKTMSPTGSSWKCNKTEIVTPGQVSANMISKSLGADIDELLNVEGLEAALAMIINAGINRLTEEAIGGLAQLSTKNKSEVKCSELSGGQRAACYAAKAASNASKRVKNKFKNKMNKRKTKTLKHAIEDVQDTESLQYATSTEDIIKLQIKNLDKTKGDLENLWSQNDSNNNLKSASSTLHEAQEINNQAFELATTTEGLIICNRNLLENIESNSSSTNAEIQTAKTNLINSISDFNDIKEDTDLINEKFNVIDEYATTSESISSEIDTIYSDDIKNITSTIESGTPFKLQTYRDDLYDLINKINTISTNANEIKTRVLERKEKIELELASCENNLND